MLIWLICWLEPCYWRSKSKLYALDPLQVGTSVALKEMSTVLDAEREALELDSIPEYLNDSNSPQPSRETAVAMAPRVTAEREVRPEAPVPEAVSPVAHKADELETLWPGVHHELHGAQAGTGKSPSFYMSVGFMAGAVISALGVIGYFSVSQLVAHNPIADKQVAVASAVAAPSSHLAPAAPSLRTEGGADVLTPSSPQYQVQTGDTLAGIAMKNYKRVSPRLLDEIVKSNNLRNANVLSLGQTLNLPEYHSHGAQVAGAGQIQ